MKIFGRFAPNFVDFPSKNNENSKISGPKCWGALILVRGRLFSQNSQNLKFLGGALIKVPKILRNGRGALIDGGAVILIVMPGSTFQKMRAD